MLFLSQIFKYEVFSYILLRTALDRQDLLLRHVFLLYRYLILDLCLRLHQTPRLVWQLRICDFQAEHLVSPIIVIALFLECVKSAIRLVELLGIILSFRSFLEALRYRLVIY